MSLAVPPENWDAFSALAQKRDVEVSAVGTFTASGALVIRHGERIVARLGMDFLHGGCPKLDVPAVWTKPSIPAPKPARGGSRNAALKRLLGTLNTCSKEYKSRIYDGEVKGLSVVKPFIGVKADIPSDATVLRVDYDDHAGIALAEGINPFYSDLDTWDMAMSVVDEAVRRCISVGAKLGDIAGLDNFCWPDPVLSDRTPDGPYKMAQLVRCNRALHDLCVAYGVPLISGKDSMKNDSTRGGRKISIPPTLLFSAMARLADVRKVVTPHAKRAGDVVYLAGLTRDELGASEYHRMLAADQGAPQNVGGQGPRVFIDEALALYTAHQSAIERGLLHSSHTPTLGGLGVALAFVALGGDLGLDVNLDAAPLAEKPGADAILFGESNSRFVLTCAPEKTADLEAAFQGVALARIGTVTADRTLRATLGGKVLLDTPTDPLRVAFKKTLDGI
jgi:phosphoribosylformylglycinamidine synthase